MTKVKRLVGGYYGTRNADFFPALFIKRAGAGTIFSDITAGTGQFPYRMACEFRKPVVLFERCPYVGYLLRSIFEGEIQRSQVAKQRKLPEGRLLGFLSKNRNEEVFSEEMAARIDFLCQHAQLTQDVALSHAIGRALNSTFSFRSMNWSRTMAGGQLSTEASIEKFEAKILRALEGMQEYYSVMPGDVVKASSVFIGDSVKLVPKIGASGALKGGVVYADPAWPWATGSAGNDNPYRFAYEDLSSILDQKQHRLDTIWSRDDEARIKSETLGWIRASFASGARQFISCTQDTNFPHPDVVRSWFIDAGLKVPHTMLLHDRSASASRTYGNYWFFIEE